MKLSTADIRHSKGNRKLACITAYNALFARMFDEYVDVLLVGDSLGMVLYDMPTTLPVSLQMMHMHGKAVAAAAKHATVVVDMPFGSYQSSPSRAFDNAARMLQKTGAQAVKLEGGQEMADTVAFLTSRAIPVMGHVGMQPQSINIYGGFKRRGKSGEDAARIMDDALAIAEAGAFAIVIEAAEEGLAAEVARRCEVPVIGIGAGRECDGQIAVAEDILGLTDNPPPFITPYADLSSTVREAIAKYAADI